MRPFILADMYRQMPYLPLEMQGWPRECVLTWMRLFTAPNETSVTRTDRRRC